jgi:hypothetical protein
MDVQQAQALADIVRTAIRGDTLKPFSNTQRPRS